MKFNSLCAAFVLALSLLAPQFSALALGSSMQTAQSSNGLSFWIYFPSDKIYTNTETGALICSGDKIDYESANIGLKKEDGTTISSPFKPVQTINASCAQINLISFFTSGRWDLTVKFDQKGDQVVFPLTVEPIENADPSIHTISAVGGNAMGNATTHATFRYIKDQNTNQIKSGMFCANEMSELKTAYIYNYDTADSTELTLNLKPGICTEITNINLRFIGELTAILKNGDLFTFRIKFDPAN